MFKIRKISSEFVKDLITTTDIVELIQSSINLQKKGKNYVALCPFHHENTPSFTVSKEKRFYYCFGCNVHGNSIDFLITYKGIGFIEAVKELSEINGLDIVYEDLSDYHIQKDNQKYRCYQILKGINEVFVDSWKYRLSYAAKKYLKERGLNQKMIEHFSIGFGSFLESKMKEKLVQINDYLYHLQSVGILRVDKKGKYSNMFHNRITFPIRNIRGVVVAFGGRSLNYLHPKYINSPDSIIFKKGQFLYGIYEVIKECCNPPKLLVVEGYIDVISLKQFHINYAVAILGTSLTKDHIKMIFRFTSSVVFCFDGDKAGYSAAWRTLNTIISHMEDNRQVKFMFLPKGYDPDKMIREEGKAGFERRIEESQLLSSFLFNRLKKKIDLSNNEGKAKFSTLVYPIICKIPGYVFKKCMFNELSRIIGVPIREKNTKGNLKKDSIRNFLEIRRSNNQSRTILLLIKLLVRNPNFANLFPNFSISGYRDTRLLGTKLFVKIFETCRNYPNIDTHRLKERFRNDLLFKKFEEISKNYDFFIEKDIEKKIFEDAILHLISFALDKRLDFLISKERKIGLTIQEKQEVSNITSRKMNDSYKVCSKTLRYFNL
ncbi:DNA primase [Candidatus Riesia pediculischaeffi]|uniref:DNA primase n=1 Tax=Candidatus Riesia pediculischaeffi PTSU TaxID=1401651 RepID=A0A0C1SAH9_9ENTR|nr:DNA primase [Candidatus Riesia pediculischaeffi]KIE64271.1 DNA primase [Candidatus Riesia pediculischaeffi PTSU]